MAIKNILVLSVLFALTFLNLLLNYPLSVGEQYFSRLKHWTQAAWSGDWFTARILERSLDQADLQFIKAQIDPVYLEAQIRQFNDKKNRTPEDYLAIAKISLKLNRPTDAFLAVSYARQLDPVRDDIDKLYFTFPSSLRSSTPR